MDEHKLKILIPTNFSGHALTAAEYAVELFKDMPVEFILENVFQVPKWSPGTLISIHDIVSKEVNEKLNRERELLKSKYKSIQISIQASEGNTMSIIKNTLRKKHLDLLVIGHNSHIKGFFYAFIEQPDYWPVLLVPYPPVQEMAKEAIMVSDPVNKTASISSYWKDIDKQFKGKLHSVYFTENDTIEHLKDEIDFLQKRYKARLVLFNVSKGGKLEQAIMEHRLDSVFLCHPALLVSSNNA